MNIATAAILLVFLCEVSSVEEYVIERKINGDRFTIPRSKCTEPSSHDYCDDKRADQISYENGTAIACICECYSSSPHIFGFSNTWTCRSNSTLVNLAAAVCAVLYVDNGQSRNVTVVPSTRWIGQVEIKQTTNCTFQDQFSYLDCHGNWTQMNNAGRGFDLKKQVGYNWYDINHEGYKTLGQYNPPLHGRVIKLNIDCQLRTAHDTKSYCVVLKVLGKVKCSLNPPSEPQPAPQPTSTPSPLPTLFQASSTITTIMPNLVVTTSSQIQSASKKSALIKSTGGLLLPLTSTSTKSTKSAPTKEPFLKDDKKKSSTADNTSIIAGAVSGVVALLGVLIVILIIMKLKRKRRLSIDTTRPVQDGDDNIYDQPQNESTPTGQESMNNDQYEYAYGGLVRNQDQATNRKSGIDFPVYNTLEEPVSVKPEPVYNVLEKTDTEGTKEGSFYDVLEGPESADRNVYRSLEPQDPHVYGSLNQSPEDNEGADKIESNYDVVGGMISLEPPVYDVLEGPDDGQHVYDSLNSSIIAARQLNRGHDNVLYDSTDDFIPLSKSSIA